ncbi:hypothetical protein AMECASPLE_009179 [Ameca splendens]|uniref:Uncharacterized protein n=1 Tax=Ameca splendens TaxID=208324 RepID=A0ABV0ZL86_9TELE
MNREDQRMETRPLLLLLGRMPGWRRNLTFCLQRMHEEGKPHENGLGELLNHVAYKAPQREVSRCGD